ncbi:S9 family peptidase [Anaeromyxobacter oryzae]|uniref:Peptidase S9 n=1 Tax=Anaeromyxobacter oryzae TaxID=2918170 RepID=A0ABM7WV48_9BACT|nr:S9 family peptidase [Anaeromyxobacter oryzae]BDG03361.1 peptidase S9 [Anaeromyxobacter oryzae]
MTTRPVASALVATALLLACAHAPGPSAAAPGATLEALSRAVRFPEVALAPDGGTIAFTSSRSGAVELWTVAASAGATPRQVTTAGERVTSPDVGPDGTMVFGSDHGGDERYDLFVVRPGAAPARASGTPAAELRPRLSPDGHRVAYVADRDRPFRTNLFVRDLEAGAPRALTRGEVPVLGPVWSRDGRLLAAVRTPDEEQHGELLLVDVDSGAVRVIPPPSEDGLLAPLAGLPDGRFLARATNGAGFLQLAIVDPRDGSTRLVGPGDWDVEWAAAADDGSVAWLRNVHGRSELAFAPGPDPFAAAPRVLLADGVVSAAAIAMDRAGRRIALVDEAPDRPARLAVIDPRSGALEVVVTPEAGGADLSRLPRAAMRTFRSFDGTSIDAWLWTPPAALLGSPPPCVVLAHGGPSGQVRGGFAPLPLALAEAGFVVVAPNFRGSTGYGRAFEDLNNKDWGGGDLGDLLAVVDALAASGTLDRARVGITGGSYGGYLTLRAITAAPDRFAAAVDLFGMPDLAVDYELTKDRFGLWYETEMGTPATEPDLFRARSPIHALDRVRAPLLVLQGANDTNVPRAESEEVVEKLRRRGAAVEYVLYPGEGHGFTHRANVLDAHRRTVAFFVRYLGGAKPAR